MCIHMTEIKIYELPNYAHSKFKKITGREVSHEVAQKELARMIHLGIPVKKDYTYNQCMYLFDEYRIRVNTTIDNREVITGLWLLKEPIYGWQLNMKKYNKLGKKLGIQSMYDKECVS